MFFKISFLKKFCNIYWKNTCAGVSFFHIIPPVTAHSNTLKQCLGVFDHFARLELKRSKFETIVYRDEIISNQRAETYSA